MQSLSLEPLGMARASISLLSSERDPTALWVLQGRSLGRVAGRVHHALGSVHNALQQAKSALGLHAPPAPREPSDERDPGAPAPPARVLALRLDGALRVEHELPLPEASVPLFLSMASDGRLLVSLVSSDAAHVEALAGLVPDLSSLAAYTRGTLQLGRVVALDPRGTRAAEPLLQGMAMFFDVEQLPDGQLVCSVMRLGASGFPPGLGVRWSIEAPHLDAVAVRTLSWTFLLPPYVSPPLSLQ